MRIAHVSDVHIRNLKFHSDYKKVFENFYEKLEELKVDIVVNTGDTAHTKTNISPEFVSMASEFFVNIADIVADQIIILGNHDLNLMNSDREDAISPIVEALNHPHIHLLKNSGPWKVGNLKRPDLDKLCFWNLGIADVQNWPRPPYGDDEINIGLFHGSVRNCVTDSNFRMTHVEYDHDIFEGLDFVMMGDIHKRQSFNEGRVWYAGSMIQQNFGEDPDKGFLLWDIKDKNKWTVEFIELKGNRRFYTVKIDDDLRIPDINIEPKSRLRLSPPRPLTLVEQKTVEKLARKKFDPHDIITLNAQNISQMTAHVGGADYRVENLRDITVQENLLKKFLEGKKLPQDIIDRIVGLNRKYQTTVEQREDMARGVNWRVLKMGWNNLYNYGDGNVIDFNQIRGLTGIFAPNAAGKSGLIDVITVGMFDANTKEVSKNIHLVNDNKDKAVIILEMLANKERYGIQREIERVKYGQKKGDSKEWGKTTLDFVRYDQDGGVEKLVQESRPDTEKQIRRRFGTFDDFMLTSLFAQWDPMDIIMCKETDRKRILYRFLDLDIFEDKAKLAKEDSKEWLEKLADLEENNYEDTANGLRDGIEETLSSISAQEKQIEELNEKDNQCQSMIEKLLTEKSNIPKLQWDLHTERLSLQRHEEVIRNINKKVEQAKTAIVAQVDKVDELTLKIDKLSSKWSSAAPSNYAAAQQEKSTCERLLEEAQKKLADAERQTRILEKVPCEDKFPQCQFLIDAFRVKKILPELKENVDALTERLKMTDESWWNAKEAFDALQTTEYCKKEIKDRNDIINKNKSDIATFTAQIEREHALRDSAIEHIKAIEDAAINVLKNDEIDREIEEAREEKKKVTKDLVSARFNLTELNKKLGADQGMLERIDKALATLKDVKDTCTAFEHFTDAMGKDGIALQVLKQKLPVINEEINKILSNAAEFGVFIEYDEEDQSIKLYIQYGQYKSRLLELGSGAEKFLSSVALRSALLSISNLPRSNMFIIDEGFGKLDPQNLEAVSRMFDYLKSVFDHVIVISHTDIMKDLVDNSIEITADDEGYAHVEIGA